VPRVSISEIIRDFTTAIITPFDLQDSLHRLTIRALPALEVDGCGIMVRKADGGLGFAAASSEAVVRVEQHQAVINEGACFEAYERNEPVMIRDIETEDGHWDGYRARMLEAGFRAVLGIPMNAFGQTIGVMNLYRTEPGPWSVTTLEDAQIVTAVGAGALVYANQLHSHREVTRNLERAIEHRDLIGQAKGILMAKHEIDADTAFDILRDASQRSNRPVREIAGLVARGQLDV
jgi:GAF domain-containing protein